MPYSPGMMKPEVQNCDLKQITGMYKLFLNINMMQGMGIYSPG
jgi:hypothetical protein